LKKDFTEATPLISDFCNWLKGQKKSPSTIDTYRRELGKYQKWLQENDRDIHQLEKNDIQSYIHFLEQQQKSLATIDKKVGAIRTFAKFLEKPDLTFGIEVKPVGKKNEIETLSSIECNELLKKVKEECNLRNIAIVCVLLHTGIRVSELCNLNRSHIDLVHHELTIDKNGEKRVIPLSQETREHLQNYLDSHSSQEAIFISLIGERLTERAVQYILKKYDVNPQKIRHTFCQRLIDNNVDLETVSRLAGHKDINVTKRYVKSQMNKQKVEDAINHAFTNDSLE